MAQQVITDPVMMGRLDKIRQGISLTVQERKELYQAIKYQEWSRNDTTYTFMYRTTTGDVEVNISIAEFESWSDIRETNSAMISDNDITSTAAQSKLEFAIKELRAQRLDESDACNITNPSHVISPCGCHYSKDDIKAVIENGTCKDEAEAYKYLATTDKYKDLSSDIKAKLQKDPNDGGISLDKEYLMTLYKVKEENLLKYVSEEGNNIYYFNPTEAQKMAAMYQNTVPGPREAIGMYPDSQSLGRNATSNNNMTNATPQQHPTSNTVIAENDMAIWLLEHFNRIFRDDGRSPQIPTSIGASIALVRGGNSSTTFGRYNFWKLPYDESLTSVPQDSTDCAFSTENDGIRAVLSLLYSSKYKEAISPLEPKMCDTKEEDKVIVTRSILMLLAGNDAEVQFNQSLEFVKKYDMRSWDTDKKEEEGGHADTKVNSSDGSKNVDSRLAKAAKHLTEVLADKGLGVLVIPIGPNHSKIIKLPVGKTYCEPIYPDFITVGDRIPEWIMSATYAQTAKEAEEAALKAAGIAIQSQDEIELEYINNKISAFQEQQFAAWCQANGISYTDDTEKAAAIQTYREAAAKDPENFINDVWVPDEASRNVYKSLLREKSDIQYNGDTATAAAHLQYVEATKTVAEEIKAREGGWNQNSGTAITAEQAGNKGGTDFSAIDQGSSVAVKASFGSVERMVSWAEGIARDQTHGYSQGAENATADHPYTGSREGPDYDCSSLVYHALTQGGFDVISLNGGSAGNADTIWSHLAQIAGWKKYRYSDIKDSIQRGDILVRIGYHAGIAIDSQNTVEAKGASMGSYETGDQGREIDFYDIAGYPWDEVYRYQGS